MKHGNLKYMAIDKNTNWNGRTGSEIEQYVKNTFESKVGAILKQGDEYLLFSDSITRAQYEEDNNLTNLIIDKIQIQSSYIAEVTLSENTKVYNTASLGSTGHNISFTGNIKHVQGFNITDQIKCTYTIARQNDKQVLRDTKFSGEEITFNIDNYLLEGENTVTIEIESVTYKVKASAILTYKVVNLQVDMNYDISEVYTSTDKPIELTYSITGISSGTRNVYWLIDGELLDEIDVITDSFETINKSKSITIPENLFNTGGTHFLQMYVGLVSENGEIASDVIYKEFMIYNESIEAMSAISQKIPSSVGYISERKVFGLVQYSPYTLEFATYVPGLNSTYDAEVLIGNTEKGYVSQGIVSSRNGNINKLVLIASDASFTHLQIKINTGEKVISNEFPITITPTTMNIQEIKEDLEFSFDCIGKANNSVNRDSWNYENYTGVFEGFDWNNNSGWVNNSLRINNGASFSIYSGESPYSPLSNISSTKGKTIELEFRTLNVSNDDAILCDLRTNGIGLVIRATKVELISKNSKILEYSFKDEEPVRIGFVINPVNGGNYPRLSMLYVNGIISRCTDWLTTDNYNSSAPLKFTGTSEAEIELSYIRIYNQALSNNQILNNYILYRSNILEMSDIYNRNNIFLLNSNVDIDTVKASQRLPIMIVTGSVDELEKDQTGDTVIEVDIEYTNIQDPSLSFKIERGFMRIQGTSSLLYPRKNFRIYTRYKGRECNKLIVNGNEISSKLYSFIKGDSTRKPAQPVDCWCLKADFMESSSSHNTGIARLWNEALYNTSVEHTNNLGEKVSGNVLRTKAQITANENNYNYDVRTTIDGFPILLFYRQTSLDKIIFLGKYNFNNDKSTPNVFGFEGVPGFNNENVQCWEVLDSSNSIALFTNISNFNTKWSDAFESRYPDTDNPDITALKSFSTWINNLYRIGYTEASEDFRVQKWEHFDIYKMAAYYAYLMRFGAVDQTVKNAMFTTEDGQHWFYINYDNDTVNGLNNVGELVVPPNAMRDSINPDTKDYYYAGKDSVLWNFLENDTEFMDIVSVVDNALTTQNLRYSQVIEMFNEKQTSKWAETIYNLDADYKYLQPFKNGSANRLYVIQGNRNSHRSWWLAKRFALLDSKLVSGEFKSNTINLTFRSDASIDTSKPQFTITAGESLYYGYGIKNGASQTGEYIEAGDSKGFSIAQDNLNIGTATSIYGAMYIKELDLSTFVNNNTEGVVYHNINTLSLSGVYNETLGTKLEVLKVGSAGHPNNTLDTISGLNTAVKLKYLDLQNIKNIITLDISNLSQLEELYTQNSGITSIEYPKGGLLNKLQLSDVVKDLVFEDLPYLNLENINDGNYDGDNSYLDTVTNINIKNCPGLTNNFNWVKTWYEKQKETDNTQLILEGVNWSGVDINDLIALGSIKSNGILTLKGNVGVVFPSGIEDTEKEELATTLTSIYSNEINNGDLNISGISIAYIQGPDEVLEGGEYQYTAVSVGNGFTKITYNLSGNDNSSGLVTIDSKLGILKVKEGISDTVIFISALISGDEIQTVSKNITIVKRTYPTSVSIDGDLVLNEVKEYTYKPIHNRVTGDVTYNWSLTSNQEGALDLLELSGSNEAIFKINVKESPLETYEYTLTLSLSRTYNGSTIKIITTNIKLINEDVIETDAGVIAALRNAWGTDIFTSEIAITKQMVEDFYSINENGSIFPINPDTLERTSIFENNTNIKSFNGFQYFRETVLPKKAFSSCRKLTSIRLPEILVEIGESAFYSCTSLTAVPDLPKNIITIKNRVFESCDSIKEIDFTKWPIDYIPSATFGNCNSIKSIIIPPNINKIGQNFFTSSFPLDIFWIQFSNSVLEADYNASSFNLNIGNSISELIIERYIIKSNSQSSASLYSDSAKPNNITYNYIQPNGYEQLQWKFGQKYSPVHITYGPRLSQVNGYWNNYPSYTNIDSVRFLNSGKIRSNLDVPSIDTIEIGENVTEIDSSFNINLNNPKHVIFNAINCLSSVTLVSPSLESFTFGDKVTRIPANLCQGLPLSLIDIPKSVKYIQTNAFKNSQITEITLSLLYELGESAFENCVNLTKVTFDGGTEGQNNAFLGCTNITEVHSNTNYDEGWGISNFKNEYANPLYSGADLYINGELLTNVTHTLLDSNRPSSNGNYLFSGCTSIQSIHFIRRESITYNYTIPQGFCKNCVNLTSITTGDTPNSNHTRLAISSIYKEGFMNTGLTELSFSNAINLHDYALYRSNLTSLHILNTSGAYFGYCSLCIPSLGELILEGDEAPEFLDSNGLIATTGIEPFTDGTLIIGSTVDQSNRILRVTPGASGYDSGVYQSTLQDMAGFTIVEITS